MSTLEEGQQAYRAGQYERALELYTQASARWAARAQTPAMPTPLQKPARAVALLCVLPLIARPQAIEAEPTNPQALLGRSRVHDKMVSAPAAAGRRAAGGGPCRACAQSTRASWGRQHTPAAWLMSTQAVLACQGPARLLLLQGNYVEALADATAATELDDKLTEGYREKGCVRFAC